MKKIKKYALIFSLTLIVCLLVFIHSTVGWLFLSKSYKPTQNRQIELASLAQELEVDVRHLSETLGNRDVFGDYDNLQSSAEYIAKKLADCGYDVQRQEYSVYRKKVENIFAIKKSKNPQAQALIIGAHYDTCSNPGADDNGSAVAGVLALAKSLAKVELESDIHFVLFVNEEPPFFQTDKMGSLVYAKSLKKQAIDVKGAIILEMIGYYSEEPFSQKYPIFLGPFFPNKGNFIMFVSNFDSYSFLKKTTKGFAKHSDFPYRKLAATSIVPGIDFSDHWSFWQEDYPAIMVTDTAFFRNENYHQPTDTYDKLNYLYMAEIISGITEMIKNNDI